MIVKGATFNQSHVPSFSKVRKLLLRKALQPSHCCVSDIMSPSCHHHVHDRWAPFTLPAKTTDTMGILRKASVYKRRNIKGWWVGWYEGGKKRAKALPSKALAKHFCQIKYTQWNSAVFTGIVTADGRHMVEEYQRAKQVEGLREASIYEAMLTLGHFERLTGPDSSKQIDQNALDRFVLDRGSEVQKTTLNKDIRNLNAFLHWAAKNRFIAPGPEDCWFAKPEVP